MLDTANTPVSTTIYRKDYQPPVFLINSVELSFQLDESQTVVHNRMSIQRNPASNNSANNLWLDGVDLQLQEIACDGVVLDKSQYTREQNGLSLSQLPDEFKLDITTVIYPHKNTTLMGLYKSSGNFCTQCEAEGFRKITYYPDRPDVLSVYTVKVTADKSKYPVLLSNGNRIETGDLKEGMHWAKWHDPFPKPSYLFALVAGDLASITDQYKTASGQDIRLEIYSERHNIDQCNFALESLKKSMLWDEQVYGLEYDLDVFMIVAVDDFNMGAMENKGLNIFNTKYVLAQAQTATDSDFLGVESVIAHEYFHNWSGNRVTCRDWFQLSLKEGFTVFRDQEFSADMHSRGVKRADDVNVLRTYQFREDSGPMAHPVRPESYQEINNFYTLTIYNKGAEVVRMLATIIGAKGFRKGSDLYFQRHDGQAVTIEDFVNAMEDANNIKLDQFRRWYSQAGTPKLKVSEKYDAEKTHYTLTIQQSCPQTPGQKNKLPFHIPIKIGLLSESGEALILSSPSEAVNVSENKTDAVLELTDTVQEYVFEQVNSKPICSFLREFSAPVNVEINQTQEQLSLLMAKDSDSFNRFDASQRLMTNELLTLIQQFQQGERLQLSAELVEAVGRILVSEIDDRALAALALTPPGEIYLSTKMQVIDPVAIHEVRNFLIKSLAQQHYQHWLSLYESLHSNNDYLVDQQNVGRRSLRQCCLDFLVSIDDENAWKLANQQYRTANNMTERLGGFKAVLHTSSPDRQSVIDDFYQQYKGHALAMDKWLAIQATLADSGTINRVKELEQKRVFDRKNPNKLRSLVGAFVSQNPVCFHAIDGSGYAYLKDWIVELDAVNPQVAARLVSAFNNWRRYDEQRAQLIKQSLQDIISNKGLSPDVAEIVSKALEA